MSEPDHPHLLMFSLLTLQFPLDQSRAACSQLLLALLGEATGPVTLLKPASDGASRIPQCCWEFIPFILWAFVRSKVSASLKR